jgi:p-hydroxybenzoate 3-monooxygenase
MTAMLHPLLGDPFEDRLAIARLDYVVRSQAAAKSLAENYVDLANL